MAILHKKPTTTSNVWNVNTNKGFDALGDVLKPASASSNSNSNQMNVVATGYAGNSSSILALQQQQHHLQQQQQQYLLQSQNQHQQHQQEQQAPTGTGKIITGDLDSSLMSLVDNLNINKTASAKWVKIEIETICACVRKWAEPRTECCHVSRHVFPPSVHSQ